MAKKAAKTAAKAGSITVVGRKHCDQPMQIAKRYRNGGKPRMYWTCSKCGYEATVTQMRRA